MGAGKTTIGRLIFNQCKSSMILDKVNRDNDALIITLGTLKEGEGGFSKREKLTRCQPSYKSDTGDCVFAYRGRVS